MSIQTRLLILILSIMAPAVIGAVWSSVEIYHQQKESTEKSLQGLAQALAAVVDTEISQREAVLKTLAESLVLLRGDLREFHRYAQRMAPTVDQTIVLSDLEGRQIINSRLPFASPKLPTSTSTVQLRKKLNLDPSATLVSDLYFAPVGKRPSFAVQIPVTVDGRVAFYLSMGSYVDQLQRLVVDPRLGDGWNASIFDRQGMAMARRHNPERYVGQPSTAFALEHFKSMREGVIETKRMDGTEALTAFSAVGDIGWTFVVSMPKEALSQPQLKTSILIAIITITLFLLSLTGAIVASRNISYPLRDLARRCGSLARGEGRAGGSYGLSEADLIADALVKAGQQAKEVNWQLEQRIDVAVAESRRMQEQVLQSQKLEALGRLTGGIAHDFNNLLQTISTSLHLIALKKLDSNATRAVEGAQRAVKSGAVLARQLMTFGKVQKIVNSTISIPDEMARLSELLSGALTRNIEMELKIEESVWPITVDAVQFELALLNICFNARDAMPNGGVVTISAANEVVDSDSNHPIPAGEYVALCISDTGPGIPKEIRGRVFDPFFTTKETGKGSGLGLAQVYGFAKQSGGVVTIEDKGLGTTICLRLPRSTQQFLRPDENANAVMAKPAKPYHILFVEDDLRVREAVVPALRDAGFRVISAYDADSALQELTLRRIEIDIVFSDIVMPGGKSGIDLANIIHQLYPKLPIVLATGYSESDLSGFTTLKKPYQIDDLVAALLKPLAEK